MNGGNAAANLSSEVGIDFLRRAALQNAAASAPVAYTPRMRIVTYRDLRPGRFVKPLERLRAALARGDFAAAGLKKLTPSPYWRGKLSDEARLLLQFAPYNGETVCLFLEVIADHAYEKSRFLRGASVDREKIEAGPDDLEPQPEPSARLGWEFKWLPPEAVEFDLIDKPIVLDAAQETVRRHAPPLVIIGSAGSGKTAVTLAKMRDASGNVLYVTLSAYLAQTARRLYSAHGYENPHQDAEFMSFREFVEFDRRPRGRGGPLCGFPRLVRAPSGRAQRRSATGRRPCAVRGIPRRHRRAREGRAERSRLSGARRAAIALLSGRSARIGA